MKRDMVVKTKRPVACTVYAGLPARLMCIAACMALFAFEPGVARATGVGPKGGAAVPVPAVAPGDQDLAQARARVADNPSSANHLALAKLLLQKGMLDEAMSSFNEALRGNPRAYEAKTGRGVVLARKGNLKEAEQVLIDALANNPNPVRTHYELGLVYERLGQFEKAIAEFKAGIAKHEQGR